MAWTAPKTFVPNTVLTAAELNIHLRDNLLETAPAHASQPGAYFATASEGRIVERVPVRLTISDEGTTTSTSFTDLDGTVVGPSVTVTSNEGALVCWGVESWNDGGGTTRTTVDVSGATNIAGNDSRAITNMSGANNRLQASHVVYYSDLNPGSNTFEMKYRVSSGTGSFSRRRIVVFPY
ncbi:hypothetical protein AB0I72_19135 [Nocardiopsis sp. NPDC049922]|uniref:hypothetical protein n=1 Tax=Nocardiopsis sp. NPDC049922 TaxID=3155157 RepID=UPI00340B0FD1